MKYNDLNEQEKSWLIEGLFAKYVDFLSPQDKMKIWRLTPARGYDEKIRKSLKNRDINDEWKYMYDHEFALDAKQIEKELCEYANKKGFRWVTLEHETEPQEEVERLFRWITELPEESQ